MPANGTGKATEDDPNAWFFWLQFCHSDQDNNFEKVVFSCVPLGDLQLRNCKYRRKGSTKFLIHRDADNAVVGFDKIMAV